jgi:hypothetical protein
MSKNSALVYLDCDFCKLSETALNDLFLSLPDNENVKKIFIDSNPGANDCNKNIAEKKKWEFT